MYKIKKKLQLNNQKKFIELKKQVKFEKKIL